MRVCAKKESRALNSGGGGMTLPRTGSERFRGLLQDFPGFYEACSVEWLGDWPQPVIVTQILTGALDNLVIG